MNKEIRNFNVELRADGNSRHISGYAVVFNSMSEDMGFREIILPESIDLDLIDNSDVFFTFNHDMNKVLARWNHGTGSLNLELDDHGLKFSCDVPNTDLGNEVLEYIKRNDLSKCSFAFSLSDDDDSEEWTKTDDGELVRTIKKIGGLYDVSVVWNPAYQDTEIYNRSYDDVKKRLDKLNSLHSEINKLSSIENI